MNKINTRPLSRSPFPPLPPRSPTVLRPNALWSTFEFSIVLIYGFGAYGKSPSREDRGVCCGVCGLGLVC